MGWLLPPPRSARVFVCALLCVVCLRAHFKSRFDFFSHSEGVPVWLISFSVLALDLILTRSPARLIGIFISVFFSWGEGGMKLGSLVIRHFSKPHICLSRVIMWRLICSGSRCLLDRLCPLGSPTALQCIAPRNSWCVSPATGNSSYIPFFLPTWNHAILFLLLFLWWPRQWWTKNRANTTEARVIWKWNFFLPPQAYTRIAR